MSEGRPDEDATSDEVEKFANDLVSSGHFRPYVGRQLVMQGLKELVETVREDPTNEFVIPMLEQAAAQLQAILTAYNAAIRPQKDN